MFVREARAPGLIYGGHDAVHRRTLSKQIATRPSGERAPRARIPQNVGKMCECARAVQFVWHVNARGDARARSALWSDYFTPYGGGNARRSRPPNVRCARRPIGFFRCIIHFVKLP